MTETAKKTRTKVPDDLLQLLDEVASLCDEITPGRWRVKGDSIVGRHDKDILHGAVLYDSNGTYEKNLKFVELAHRLASNSAALMDLLVHLGIFCENCVRFDNESEDGVGVGFCSLHCCEVRVDQLCKDFEWPQI